MEVTPTGSVVSREESSSLETSASEVSVRPRNGFFFFSEWQWLTSLDPPVPGAQEGRRHRRAPEVEQLGTEWVQQSGRAEQQSSCEQQLLRHGHSTVFGVHVSTRRVVFVHHPHGRRRHSGKAHSVLGATLTKKKKTTLTRIQYREQSCKTIAVFFSFFLKTEPLFLKNIFGLHN